MLQRQVRFLVVAALGYFVAAPTLAYQREVQNAAGALAEKLAASGKRSIAVVDFTDLQGNVTELGRFLAEELSVALASGSQPVEVVDRTHLKVLLQEHKLSATGLIDPATAKKLGQIAGVDALVTGTLTPFGDSVRLALKVLDTSTARIVAASSAEIAKTKAIEELVARAVGSAEPNPRATGTVQSATPTSAMPEPIESDGFRFTFKRCKHTGGEVHCELIVENLGETTVRLSVESGSNHLYDQEGNEYGDVSASLGKNRSQNVIPGVPLAARITFRAVPNNVRQASLSLVFSMGGIRVPGYHEGAIPIVFRSVPIT